MRRFSWILLPPLIVAALMMAAYSGAVRTSGAEVFTYDTWIKWDSGHYEDISTKGYEFISCDGIPGFHPGQWCGNAGWFPGYPYFVHGVRLFTGGHPKLVLILVSQAFAVVSLLLVWNLLLARRDPLVLLLCAFAPGTYYFLVAFPMSMTVCFILLTLWAQRERHHAAALAAGIVVGFTYPSGICLAGVLAGALLVEHWRGERRGALAWLPVTGPIAGFCLVLVVHHLAVGQWNAFFLTQEKYQHGINNPLLVLWQRSAFIWVWKPGWQTGIQSLIATALVVAGAVATVRAVRRRQQAPGDAALATHGATYWLFPLVLGGGLSPYRAESLLMPAMVALRRLPKPALVLLTLAAFAIWIIMATEFAHGWLV
jgi:hypothetical protein